MRLRLTNGSAWGCGDLQVHRGQIEEGLGNLREALRRSKEGGYDIFAPWLTCCQAEGLVSLGRIEEARSLVGQKLAEHERTTASG